MRYAYWLVLAVFLAPAAEAQETTAYYGLSLGSFDYKESGFAQDVIHDTASTYHVMVGYQFTPHIGVEGAYGKTGTIRDVGVFSGPTPFTAEYRTKFSILTVRLLGVMNFDSGITVLGGFGYANMTQRERLDAGSLGMLSNKSTRSEATYLAGVQYDWDRTALRLAYEKYDFGGGVKVAEKSLTIFYKL